MDRENQDYKRLIQTSILDKMIKEKQKKGKNNSSENLQNEQKALEMLKSEGISKDFEKLVDSLPYEGRVRVWAKQFKRPQSWVRSHTSKSDSAYNANIKLVKILLNENL
jgi:hypothetical protein